MRVDILSDSNCCSEPVSYAVVEEDGTSGLVIEVFDDSDNVCADVVLLHGCPQSSMPNLDAKPTVRRSVPRRPS